MTESHRNERRHYPVRKTTLQEQDDDPELENTTAAERLGMMWQLTLDAWAFTGRPPICIMAWRKRCVRC